jgi:steroid delta-isomerase-like uncharacterized protein
LQQYNTVTGNIEHIREFVDVIWNRRQVDAINDYLAEDYLDHAYQPGNVQGLLAMLNELGAAFPDARQDIETITAQDDMVVCRMHLQATHTGAFRTSPAGGNRVSVALYRSFRLHEGKIAEHWALLDTAGLLRQIGTGASEVNACRRA